MQVQFFNLHACNTHVSCIKIGDWEVKNHFPHLCNTYMYTYRSRWDGVSIRLNIERFRTNTYMILSTYTFLTCIKHVLSLMKHACHLPVICLSLLLHALCMLPLFWHTHNVMHFAPTVTCLLSWHALHISIIFMLQACLCQHACKC